MLKYISHAVPPLSAEPHVLESKVPVYRERRAHDNASLYVCHSRFRASRDLLFLVEQLLEGKASPSCTRSAWHTGDLKSSNVLVDGDARLWIVDYDADLAEILDEVEDDEVGLVSGFRGTHGFTAQEVGSEYYDPAAG